MDLWKRVLIVIFLICVGFNQIAAGWVLAGLPASNFLQDVSTACLFVNVIILLIALAETVREVW